jgi:endo-1,4-beta-D-glucanase Y
MRSLKIHATLAILLSCLATPAIAADHRTAYAPRSGLTAPQPVLPAAAWRAYRDRFIQPDGRLVDIDNGGVSHSEGQGYGMLLAVLADDRETFARLWNWSVANLYVRGDNLAAWRWTPNQTPPVGDKNNATDGDLLIAWALARAAQRWPEPSYRAAARRIALAIGKLIEVGPTGPVLPPGAFGFARGQMPDGPVINLSYVVFPALDELRTVAPDVKWEDLRRAAALLVESARTGPARLPPDWISLAGEQVVPARFQPAVFGYESIRIPLYLAWSSAGTAKALGAFSPFWTANGEVPGVIDLASGRIKEPMREAGYRAVVALARCVATGQPVSPALMQLDASRYYPATLQMLTLAAAIERHPACLRAVAQR